MQFPDWFVLEMKNKNGTNVENSVFGNIYKKVPFMLK